jgi:hypothetical protein
LVSRSLNDELGFPDATEEIHVRRPNRNAQPYESGHAPIVRSDGESNARTERKSYETNRKDGEASAKIIQGRRDVFTFAEAMAEASGAFPNSPKIEAQRRETCLAGGLRGSENHLVVHRPAVERVRMAHHRREAWLPPRVPFKQGFESSLGAGDEKIFDLRNPPPLANLPVRPNYEPRLVTLLPRLLVSMGP